MSGSMAVRPYPGDVVPDTADEVFWQACRENRYLVFQCRTCGRAVWPAGSCPEHGMAEMRWTPSTGRGRLHTWTVVHQIYGSSFRDPPANVAVIELDDGPLVHSTVVDAEGRLEIGMRVRVAFEEIDNGVVLPVFRKDEERAAS